MANSRTSLIISKKVEASASEAISQRFFAENYAFGVSDIIVDNYQQFVKDVMAKYGRDLKESTFELSASGEKHIYIYNQKWASTLSNEVSKIMIIIYTWDNKVGYVSILGENITEVNAFYKEFQYHFLVNEEKEVRFNKYFIDESIHALRVESEAITEKDLANISKKYYPDFVDTDMFFDDFFSSKENICVISGESGTGKSKFSTLAIKYIMDRFCNQGDDQPAVAYIKNEKILSIDNFWMNLSKYDYKLVILEDLTNYLSPREKNAITELEVAKSQFVSNLLSFTDGVFDTKTKFIITTNKGIDSVDEALLRSGRMFGVFRFSKLPIEDAKEIWLEEGLDEKDFLEEFSDKKELLQSELGSKIYKYKLNNNSKRRSFLKEGSKADISSTFLTAKKVGF